MVASLMSAKRTIKAPFDRDRQFQEKRQAVIYSAASAFRRRGYHNTSMVQIAETLGLTKAALYYYVQNKEEILFESHRMAYDSMDAILSDVEKGEGNGLRVLEGLFRDFVLLLTQSGVSLLTDVNSLGGAWKITVLERRQAIEHQVVEWVERGQADGSIKAGDSRLHVFFFMGALNWLNAWYETDGRIPGETIAEHFVQQMSQGIRA